MTSSKFKGNLGAKRPAPVGSFMLRRVYRQGNRFCCGICRTFHSSIEDANSCLETCWKSVLKRAPWVKIKKVGHTGYACIYCQRIYSTSDLATACAEECASRMTITSFDGTDLNPNRKKHSFTKHDVVPSVNFPFKIGGKKDESHGSHHQENLNTAPEPTTEPVTNATTAAPPAPEPAPKAQAAASPEESAGKEAKDRTKKFERVGSKYECVICHKRYFERTEVEKCFDAHSGGSMDAHQNSGV
jgi:hypothetical protein